MRIIEGGSKIDSLLMTINVITVLNQKQWQNLWFMAQKTTQNYLRHVKCVMSTREKKVKKEKKWIWRWMRLEWAFKIWSRLGKLMMNPPQQGVRMRALPSTKAKGYKALMTKGNFCYSFHIHRMIQNIFKNM